MIVCSKHNAELLLHLEAEGVRVVQLPWSTRWRAVRVLTQQVVLPIVALRYRPDILLSPADVAPLAAPVPIVSCVHSSHLNRLHGYSDGMVQKLYNRLFMRGTLMRSKRLIAISGHVRSETAHMFGLDPAAIEVIYHGGGIVEHARRHGWKPRTDGGRSGGILFVGTLNRHKRADAAVRAYGYLKRQWPDGPLPGLFFVGRDPAGVGGELRELARSEGVEDTVHFMGCLSDESLLELYDSSRLLVFPSEVEGFGLPAVEAMQAGLPVVVSIHGSLPEIVGSAGICVDPDDVAAFAGAMQEALLDGKVRRRMINEGYLRGASFDWQRTAEHTMGLLKASVGPWER